MHDRVRVQKIELDCPTKTEEHVYLPVGFALAVEVS